MVGARPGRRGKTSCCRPTAGSSFALHKVGEGLQAQMGAMLGGAGHHRLHHRLDVSVGQRFRSILH